GVAAGDRRQPQRRRLGLPSVRPRHGRAGTRLRRPVHLGPRDHRLPTSQRLRQLEGRHTGVRQVPREGGGLQRCAREPALTRRDRHAPVRVREPRRRPRTLEGEHGGRRARRRRRLGPVPALRRRPPDGIRSYALDVVPAEGGVSDFVERSRGRLGHDELTALDGPPVLVAGAGPVGLITALGLTHYGLPVVVLEADDSLSTDTKAGTVLTRTLEV